MSLDIIYREPTQDELMVLAHTFDASTDDIMSGLPSLMICHVPDGGHIVNEGDGGSDVFCVLRGKVLVKKHFLKFFSRRLARLGMGDVFGEISFMNPGVRTASVIADGEARVFRMASGELFELMNRLDSVKSRLREISQERIHAR